MMSPLRHACWSWSDESKLANSSGLLYATVTAHTNGVVFERVIVWDICVVLASVHRAFQCVRSVLSRAANLILIAAYAFFPQTTTVDWYTQRISSACSVLERFSSWKKNRVPQSLTRNGPVPCIHKSIIIWANQFDNDTRESRRKDSKSRISRYQEMNWCDCRKIEASSLPFNGQILMSYERDLDMKCANRNWRRRQSPHTFLWRRCV